MAVLRSQRLGLRPTRLLESCGRYYRLVTPPPRGVSGITKSDFSREGRSVRESDFPVSLFILRFGGSCIVGLESCISSPGDLLDELSLPVFSGRGESVRGITMGPKLSTKRTGLSRLSSSISRPFAGASFTSEDSPASGDPILNCDALKYCRPRYGPAVVRVGNRPFASGLISLCLCCDAMPV